GRARALGSWDLGGALSRCRKVKRHVLSETAANGSGERGASSRESEREALAASIDGRLARGEPVSQAEFDRLAELFDDDDIEELVPPDAPLPHAHVPLVRPPLVA